MKVHWIYYNPNLVRNAFRGLAPQSIVKCNCDSPYASFPTSPSQRERGKLGRDRQVSEIKDFGLIARFLLTVHSLSTMRSILAFILFSVTCISAIYFDPTVAKTRYPIAHLDVTWRRSDGRRAAREVDLRVRLTKVQKFLLDTSRPADTITRHLNELHSAPTVVTAISGRRIFSSRWLARVKVVKRPKGAQNVVCMVIHKKPLGQGSFSAANEYAFPFDSKKSAREVERAVGIECTAYYINRDAAIDVGKWLAIER